MNEANKPVKQLSRLSYHSDVFQIHKQALHILPEYKSNPKKNIVWFQYYSKKHSQSFILIA